MAIALIKSEQEYEVAYARLLELMRQELPPGSLRFDERRLLGILVADYERTYYPADPPVADPVEAIKFEMDNQGLKRKDLVPYIGSPSKVSEVLSGKRRLSLAMIRRLHAGLGIPLESLIALPPPKRKSPTKRGT